MISHPESKTTLADMFDDSINYGKPPGITDGLGLVSVWSDQMVLDFGCGAGRNRRRIEQKGGKWVGIDIEGSSVSVKCDGHMLPFNPAEIEYLTSLLVTAASMYDMDPKPRQIIGHSFRIRFPNNHHLLVDRVDHGPEGELGAVTCEWDKIEVLINSIQASEQMATDERRLRPGPRKGAYVQPDQGQVFEEGL